MKVYSSLLLCLCTFATYAQQVQRSSLGVGGSSGSFQSGDETLYVSSSVGQQSVIGTFSNDALQLRQGFQQPPITVLPIANTSSDIDAVVFPNPVVSLVTIQFKEVLTGPIENTIYDLTGKIIKQDSKEASKMYTLDLTTLSTGTYVLVVSQNGREFSKRLIKN